VFTVMIFTDVLILILSLAVSGKYEMVFRNAAFIVSIILIRFALTEGYPYGAPLAIVAMLFGILTLMVYNYHQRINWPVAG
jgi:nicotinamide riboside transporter PnuC